MSATRNLASDPNLARAWPIASPDRSIAVTRVALTGQPGGVVAGSASQLQDRAHARLAERDQERPGPHPGPVQIIARLEPLPVELIPEIGTRVDHMATLMPDTAPDRRLFAVGVNYWVIRTRVPSGRLDSRCSASAGTRTQPLLTAWPNTDVFGQPCRPTVPGPPPKVESTLE